MVKNPPTLVLACAALLAAGCKGGSAGAGDEPGAATTASPEALFRRNCAVCHGDTGRGDGVAAYLLDPKPRNFRVGAFRLVSTENGVPTEADLVRTITRGMPGTPMPPWPQLSDEERRGLARYVLGLTRDELLHTLNARGVAPEEAAARADRKLAPGKLIAETPPAGTYPPDELRASFVELCAKCHAEDGTGRDDPAWRTAEGFPIRSRNFRRGVFKGGRDPLELYQRIVAGMPGTPMPAFSTLPPEQTWKMVRYIESLSDPAAQERAWVARHDLVAHRVDAVPAEAASPAWDGVEATPIALLPLWSSPEAIPAVTVRAAHDGERVAILLEWPDPARDVGGGATSYTDGAAIQLSAAADPPLFTMGAPGETCEIWHWRAGAGPPAPPQATADLYYDDGHGWTGAPAAGGKPDVFATARAAGNPLAQDPGGGTAAEYSAAQFGSLTARPRDAETARVDASWSDGRWRVVFVRNRTTRRTNDLDLAGSAGAPISIGFAVWDGRIGDRDGKKSVSIWNRLTLE